MRFFATISLLACIGTALAQDKKSVVIGSLIDRPNALLVISPPGANQGFLLPQLTTSQRLSIAPISPADDGLMVFDLTEKSFFHWNSSAWVKGLGDTGSQPGSQSLTYDPATQRLTISGGNNVDLATLKEIPAQTGQNGKYLTTNGTTLSWATLSSLGDITGITTAAGSGLTGGAVTGDVNLAVNTDGTTVSVNGTNQLQVSDGGISTNKLANNAVTSAKIVDGTITSADIADGSITGADIQNASITAVNIANNSIVSYNIVDGTIMSADIADNVLTGTQILDYSIGNADLANNSVTSANIQDGTVVTADIASGGASTVLTTNASGIVSWVPQSTFADNQTLSVAGNALSITGGNTVNLVAAGEVTGPLNALEIAPGGANQVMVTNLTGTDAQWVTQGGDVSGSPANSSVWRIRNRPVSSDAPALGDALVWDGTAWTPANVSAGSPTTQFYSIDPSDFQGLQPNENKDASLGLMESNNGQFAFSMLDSRTIVAPLSLPHGATLEDIVVYYEITNIVGVLTPINVRLIQKSLSGGTNIDLTNVVIMPLISIGVTSQSGFFTHTVDNSTSSYRLLIRFSHILNADQASEATQRIYGVRIRYSK